MSGTSSEQTSTSSEVTAAVAGSSAERTSTSPDVSGADLARGPAVGGTTLPRTGPAIDPGLLLMLGGALIVAGVLMVRYAPQEASALAP